METAKSAIGSELTQIGPLQTRVDSVTLSDTSDVKPGIYFTAGQASSPEIVLGDPDGSLPAMSHPPRLESSQLLSSVPLPNSSEEDEINLDAHLKRKSDLASLNIDTTTATGITANGVIANTAIEALINSPRGENAIVERSPEGRYVRFMEKLGSGASKDVYRAYDTTEGIEVAWNVVQLHGVPKAERNRIVNEVRLLERLHHPNIISFHGSWVNRERQEVNFVTEILSSGTLTSFIEKVQVIRWKIAKRWAYQILKGLEYLHSQDPPVIHRDLKCQNIFINGTSGDLRIGDLGLSTVHRTDKALSVLGTPEFMAPDLYEESAYDEKVDVYAFGMCLLEILTKEIPYKECSNAAQIYKKVTLGDKPESLSRLRSKVARDFIVLCLGEKDPVTGKYIRPSVSELLTHHFLAKSPDDDSEVIVDPPLHRRTIAEDHASTKSQGTSASAEVHQIDEQVPLPTNRRNDETSDIDDSDQFEDMPDSESNIRKVKVLIGRNEELKEENHVPIRNGCPVPQGAIDANSTTSLPQFLKHTVPEAELPPLHGSTVIGPTSVEEPNNITQSQQLIYAATVIEDHAASMPHYQDDLMKLIITLPVQGKTQNVQFTFHLVEDDPVEVAKEMVTELGIPQDAVLEISGAISALARQARIKQGHFRRQQQVVQGSAPIAVPVVVVPEPALAHAFQPHASVQGLQPLQSVESITQPYQPLMQTVGVPSQIGAAVPLPVSYSRSLSQAIVPTLHQTPSRLTQSLQPTEQMQILFKAPIYATKESPRPQQIPRKIGAIPEVGAMVSESSGQEHSMNTRESNAFRATEESFGEVKNSKGQDQQDEEDSVSEELRRLDEDYQKNVVRAQKVFDSRMDNLHRSKLEKEKEHKKTLQKHEKEKIEFERRLQQEEIEQNLRLEKMLREWEIQRQLLEQTKRTKSSTISDENQAYQGVAVTRPISPAPRIHEFALVRDDTSPLCDDM